MILLYSLMHTFDFLQFARRIASLRLWMGLVILIATSASAQSSLTISGPIQGSPGETLTFRMLQGSDKVSANQWFQVFNPDRYTGNDYVTSFTLAMSPQTDGSLVVVAPAPGRYKIRGEMGSTQAEAYFLIRSQASMPSIRGSAFNVNTGSGPLDRARVSRVFALAQRAGLNWAQIVQTGGIDLDSSGLKLQLPCPFCAGTMALDDYGWVIDEAHRQGLKVVVEPNFAGLSQSGQVAPYYAVQLTPKGWVGDLPGLLAEGSPLIPQVMQSYTAYMLQMAQIAQEHGAEAMIVGNESNTTNQPNSLLWSQKAQWKTMMASLRQTFRGKLWVGMALGACDDPNDLDIWTLGDGINAPALPKGSGITCSSSGGVPGTSSNNPSAEQMSAYMAQSLPYYQTEKLHALTGLPIIFQEFGAIPIDGVNYGLDTWQQLNSTVVRDNQEIVDYFEANMRALGDQRLLAGFFFIGVGLNYFERTDPLRQPALVNAIANWWGGDTAYFVPCMSSLVFQANFDTGGCPLDQEALLTKGWSVVQDTSDTTNQVLEGTGDSNTAWGATVPPTLPIGASSWTDYKVKLRLRLMPGAQPRGSIDFREGADGNSYSVAIGFGRVQLQKLTRTQGQYPVLASYEVPGGTQTGQWYQLEITANGATITVTLNGTVVIQITDQTGAYRSGGIRLGVGSGNGPATVDFDDITVETLSINLATGWNLVGNSVDTPITVADAFNDVTKVESVWKWVPTGNTSGITYPNWAFYTPTQSDGGKAFGAGKGYDVLTAINGGEGFWVNAKTNFSMPLPAGNPVISTSLRNMTSGWHLVSIGNPEMPSNFNIDLSESVPAAGVVPLNINSLWAWDSVQSKWYFYAPSLDAQGGTVLRDYINANGYLDFLAASRTLSPGVGFWVNKQ